MRFHPVLSVISVAALPLALLGAAPASVATSAAPAAVERFVATGPTLMSGTGLPGAIDSAFAESDPSGLTVQHSFGSATGWVKPGDEFALRTFLANDGDAPLTGVTVVVRPAPSMRFTSATPINDTGIAVVNADGTVTWNVGTLDPNGIVETLVTRAEAATTAQDAKVVWKDLSSIAEVTTDTASITTASHGPKVIPPAGGFETARYGDKPYPVVTSAYRDRAPQPKNKTTELDRILNGTDFEGSSFNLFQEMSYGQLYPEGRVPSAGIDSASWEGVEVSRFTTPVAGGPCRGSTLAVTPQVVEAGLAGDRIVDGWYQLPGDTEYYGGDDPVFPYGLIAGAPQPASKDTACGPSAKAVYDSALIADPEIDYNDFDSNRDGLVDFFMLIFVGCGGNGESQLGPLFCSEDASTGNQPSPYDNIWPHSSSLEFSYRDAATGLRGFLSSDQLRSVDEVPQCWVNDKYRLFDDCAANGGAGDDARPVSVRVGPYNVNPEPVFDSASVISHEYGHHLGLPDFYNSAFDASGTFELMASDYSQHMTIFSKQDLGWVVPQYLAPGEERKVSGWEEIKTDTGEIQWWTPAGESYTLSAANGDQNIRNGEAYAVKLPGRVVIEPSLFDTGGSANHVWWSGRGNDFGCPVTQGHNLDLDLRELADVPAGSTVTLKMQSAWDIEWDWDYGFVLGATDGENYTSFPSAKGYTTSSVYNPNNAGCVLELDNGLTGSSAAYAGGEPQAATSRVPANEVYGLELVFLEDEFDISSLAGTEASLRFGYFTDPAFDRPGWFIDDLQVLVDGEPLFDVMTFEDGFDRGRLVNGGCDEDGNATSVFCTDGWTRVAAGEENPVDHAYYLELRDRSDFDFDGHGQSDRGAISFQPGVFVQYTDESWGYGNNSLADHPAQHYLDSSPIPGSECPASATATCNNASFTAEDGRNRFRDGKDEPWIDNFEGSGGGDWIFDYGCLDLRVTSMSGEDTIDPVEDLRANATIKALAGCATPAFMTGATVQEPVGALTAAISVKSSEVEAGTQVLFDGSGSTDDVDAAESLTYAWDFGDGTSGAGQSSRHAYAAAGSYAVTLTVTDSDGNTDTATQAMTVTAPTGPTTPVTGGGALLPGLLTLALAGTTAGRLRRR